MPKIAAQTLGCKVNQFDTEAMLERFEDAGYESVDFREDADVYLINTCTVTGTGDQKSVKLIRRVHREHPNAAIVVAGCLAQRDAKIVALPGVRLILGVKRRGEVVTLLHEAMEKDAALCAVEGGAPWAFEPLFVERREGKTRATLKIQEGCDRYCAYCVIPYVRGPVRSMPLDDVALQAARLAASGHKEIVVTGIHLASYGRGTAYTLIDAVRAVNDAAGVRRVRLGSLEPVIVTDAFVEALAGFSGLCPQFHLSMQSGSETMLRRMRRRYTPEAYLMAANRLRGAFPDAAITTDVLTGFPGETEEEALETEAFVQKVGFARIHVFPYSRRAGTLADTLPDQVPENVKHERATRLIEIGNRLENCFVQKLVGTTQEALFETRTPEGLATGYTRQYAHVCANALPGEIRRVKIDRAEGALLQGTVIE